MGHYPKIGTRPLTICSVHFNKRSLNSLYVPSQIRHLPSQIRQFSSQNAAEIQTSNQTDCKELQEINFSLPPDNRNPSVDPLAILKYCHPFGIAPPPIQDIYLDGPPPICGLEKFKWTWENQLWTYRFTVIENRRRVSQHISRIVTFSHPQMDLMPAGKSHTIAFIPSLSPTSSREELRQCARMMANKGHQCLLIEYPGFHTDPHINNRIQQTFHIDDDGIYHLKEDLSVGMEEIKLPETLLKKEKKQTSVLKLAIALTKSRIKQWKEQKQKVDSRLIDITQNDVPNLLDDGIQKETVDTETLKSSDLSQTRPPDSVPKVPIENKVPIDSKVPIEDKVPYTHIHRSFMRQYIRFLLLQWGAAPLSIVAMGQSPAIFMQALDDLIELGRERKNVDIIAKQLNPEDWRYAGDGLPFTGAEDEGSEVQLIHCHNGVQISKGEACQIVRDAIVADLIRMHLDTVVFGSPFWKSPGRTYFEELGAKDQFTTQIRRYVMGRVCNFWTFYSQFTDYWKQRRFRAETFHR